MRHRLNSRVTRAGTTVTALVLIAVLSLGVFPQATRAARTRSAVTLEFWSALYDKTSLRYLMPYVNQFQKANPGIKIHFVGEDASNNFVKYTTAMSSGRGPDAILAYAFNPPVPEWAANGLIQPLDKYLPALHVKQSDWLPWVWHMENFHGHTWGFAQEYDSLLFVWNKTSFAKAGLNPNKPPRTLAELDADARRLDRVSGGQIQSAGFVPWYGTSLTSPNGHTLEDLLYQNGGHLYDEKKGNYTINTAVNVRALTWVQGYVKRLGGASKINGFISSHSSGTIDPIYTGKVAMEIVGDWIPLTIFDLYGPKNFKYGVSAVPVAAGVNPNTNTIIGSDFFVLPAGSRHSQEAAKFLSYMASKTPVLGWCKGEANVPPVKSAAFDSALTRQVPYMSVLVKEAAAAIKNPNAIVPFPSSAIYDYADAQIRAAFDQVEFGRKSPAAALALAQKNVDQYLARAKRENPGWYNGQ